MFIFVHCSQGERHSSAMAYCLHCQSDAYCLFDIFSYNPFKGNVKLQPYLGTMRRKGVGHEVETSLLESSQAEDPNSQRTVHLHYKT